MVEENYVLYQLMSIFQINTETLSTNATSPLFSKKLRLHGIFTNRF